MQLRFLVTLFLLSSLFFSGACAKQGGKWSEMEISIMADEISGVVHERFIGYAVDTAQVVSAPWWSEEGGYPPDVALPEYDFTRLALVNLARELAPSILRIGGTDADRTYFCPLPEEDCPLPEGYDWMLTRSQVEAIAEFTQSVDAEIIFTLNLGDGPRDQIGFSPDNAKELMQFAASISPELFPYWEAGNEVNGFGVPFRGHGGQFDFSPEIYAQDLSLLRQVIKGINPQWFLLAPATAYFSVGEIPSFLPEALPLMRDSIDVVTWHYYPTQSERCPAPVILDPATAEHLLEEAVAEREAEFAEEVKGLAGELPVWLGESGSAQCGGQKGVSDTMADALWFADLIGLMAEHGGEMVIRQTLSGSDYGLIDDETLIPRPSYYVALMYRRLFGQTFLKAVSPDRRRIRVHAGYGAEGGTVLVLINPLGEENIKVTVDSDKRTFSNAETWTVEAIGIDATEASINGVSANHEGVVGEIKGKRIKGVGGKVMIPVPATSVVFVSLFE